MERQRPPLSPYEAVADAMMVAQARLVMPVLKNYPGSIQSDALSRIVERRTDGKCRDGSLLAIDFLSKKYASLLQYMGLLKANDNRETEDRLFKKDYLYHCYFIVQDKQGTWYAGSPANHEREGTSPLATLLEAGSASELVAQITDIDGGEWPRGDFIEQAFQSSQYKAPAPDPLLGPNMLRVFTVESVKGYSMTYQATMYLDAA